MPFQLAFRRAGMRPDRQLDLVLHQVAEDRVEGPEPGEGAEDQAHDVLRLLVRVKDDLAGWPAGIADRQRDREFPPLGLGEPSRQHPLPDQVQFCLAHRSLQAQQQPVIAVPGIADAIGVGEQHR
jgi:hypothetical protein